MIMPVVSADTAGHYEWGDGCDGWHLVRSERLSVIQERIPPNAAEKRHYHESAEQFFYVLSGVATMELDGEMFAIHPRQGIHVRAACRTGLATGIDPIWCSPSPRPRQATVTGWKYKMPPVHGPGIAFGRI